MKVSVSLAGRWDVVGVPGNGCGGPCSALCCPPGLFHEEFLLGTTLWIGLVCWNPTWNSLEGVWCCPMRLGRAPGSIP